MPDIKKPSIDMATMLSDTVLPKRITNVLHNNKIYTISDLSSMDMFDLIAIPGMGFKSITKIEETLEFYGIHKYSSKSKKRL